MMVLQFSRRNAKMQQQPMQQQQARDEYDESIARVQAKIVELFCLTVQAAMIGDDDE